MAFRPVPDPVIDNPTLEIATPTPKTLTFMAQMNGHPVMTIGADRVVHIFNATGEEKLTIDLNTGICTYVNADEAQQAFWNAMSFAHAYFFNRRMEM